MFSIKFFKKQLNCLINHLIASDDIYERNSLIREIRKIRNALNNEEIIEINIQKCYLEQMTED